MRAAAVAQVEEMHILFLPHQSRIFLCDLTDLTVHVMLVCRLHHKPLKLTLITLKEHFNEACNLRCLSAEAGWGGGGVVAPFSLKFSRRKRCFATLTAVITMLGRYL